MNVYVLTCELEAIDWVHSIVLDIDAVVDSYLKVEPDSYDYVSVYLEKFDATTGHRQDFNELEQKIFEEFSEENRGWKMLNSKRRINLGTVKAMYDDE